MDAKRFLTVSMGILLATLQGCVSQEAPRNDLEALLMKLERSSVKVKEPVIVIPSHEFLSSCVYVCPVCGKRTRYVDDDKDEANESRLVYLTFLAYHRDEVGRLKPLAAKYGLEVSLDETDFCPNCRTDKEGYSYYLVVRDGEGRTARSRIFEYSTYPMLKAFFEGKETYESYGNEYRLKDRIPLIKKILGLGYLDEG